MNHMNHNDNEVIALGTGTSTGVPMLGCKCEVCLSENPKNQRLRASVALKTRRGKTIIVDTTTDLRTQLLTNDIHDCDACLITHEHADHVHGIDDLRPLSFDKEDPIPLHTYPKCAEHLREKFPYIFQADAFFKNGKALGGGIPKLRLESVGDEGVVAGERFQFHLLPHGHTKTLSFIHGRLGYAVDCKTIPAAWVEKMAAANLELLILDCVKREPHQTHLHLEASLKLAKKIGARRTGLIHMGHELEHEEFARELSGLDFDVFPLYDGQRLFYGD